VYVTPGSNDTLASAPVLHSTPVAVGGAAQPYGLCDIAHQGLPYDKEFLLHYNRARHQDPTNGRFLQAEPLGTPLELPATSNRSVSHFPWRYLTKQYRDGMNLYQYVRSAPGHLRDPRGTYVDPSSVIANPVNSSILRERIYDTEMRTREKYAGAMHEREIGSLVANEVRKQINPLDDRGSNLFIFTCKYGWMDLGHIFYQAWWTYENAGDLRTTQTGVFVEQFQSVGAFVSHPGSRGSAWSVEDLSSNLQGAILAKWFYESSEDIRRQGNKSPYWLTRSPYAPLAVRFYRQMEEAGLVDENYFLPWKGTWVEQVLKEDARDPRWVREDRSLTPGAMAAGKTVRTAIEFQRKGKAFKCFCNDDGTRKRSVEGAKIDCPCGIDVSNEKPLPVRRK
jgi:hypothetical protein